MEVKIIPGSVPWDAFDESRRRNTQCSLRRVRAGVIGGVLAISCLSVPLYVLMLT